MTNGLSKVENKDMSNTLIVRKGSLTCGHTIYAGRKQINADSMEKDSHRHL